ncbi:hypothetical protein FVEG_14751 [Fusarium verticillioides 7600]|uniref:Uncharacterized protein n=1 Tax=Gibberella moniliformis (strain M3125 / FGSC 7600) TaxID=334819 RepID=W7LF73_GIBM7|nr:hypothetical protein FVEG_14751 [Fusarium verticillioides 7600]EWG37241.1 hypothetical protein FVEG_14751 [Fusarium verticillioides 7600]
MIPHPTEAYPQITIHTPQCECVFRIELRLTPAGLPNNRPASGGDGPSASLPSQFPSSETTGNKLPTTRSKTDGAFHFRRGFNKSCSLLIAYGVLLLYYTSSTSATSGT